MAFDDWLHQHARISAKRHKRVLLDDKITFFQQLAALASSGTPLLQAVQICAEQSQSTRMQEVLNEIAGRVAAGCSLHDALAGHRDLFEDHWIELVGTGEVTGKMNQVLLDLNKQIREATETRRKMVGALIYPVVLIMVAVVVVTIMLWFVVPTFEDMFKEMGAELPALTQHVVEASDFIVAYGLYFVVGIVALAVTFHQYMKVDSFRRRVGAIGMALPVVGELMVQSAMYRFSNNLGLLLRSGVPILETLSSLSAVFRTNPIYRNAITGAQNRVAAGRSLADSLEESGVFTSMMTSMVRIGEESSQLSAVMDQIAPYYKEKMHGFITKLTKMLEPAIIVVMGGVMTVLMLAIYIPMFEMAGNVK